MSAVDHGAPARGRVGGAFQAINFGTRPVGALLGGILGSQIGLRPALWIAVIGGVLGAALVVRSPLPRFRLPSLSSAAVLSWPRC
jgi:predicted MFS family arabinose efflux permease